MGAVLALNSLWHSFLPETDSGFGFGFFFPVRKLKKGKKRSSNTFKFSLVLEEHQT